MSGDSGEAELQALRDKNIPIIWVLGGPGSGKGTQCEKMVKRYGFGHLSSGDLLRDEVASGSPKGKELNEMMQKGILVPREVVLDLIKQAILKKLANANGFLIDGYPREVEQGEDFEKVIAPCSIILYFEVPDEVMIERLLNRAKSSGRVDDNEETIKKRLETFHKVSKPVMQKYASKTVTIDAQGSADEIFKVCKANVDKCLKTLGQPVPPN
ncbi:unnamed protein product [Allacma fusca]|uniref:adenylate kinase n=1 Tax=Allacma fusca TaxID=39272 RepID=A0A8J2NSB7_9HEXA|nr:unnamed protein product [Allacma fusca]